MAASKIIFDDKVSVNPQMTHINQVWDADVNAIKTAINDNADLFDTLEGEVDVNTLDIVDLQDEKADLNTITSKTTTYTAVVWDYVLCDTSGGAFTVTLPTAIGVSGKEINVTKTTADANAVTVNTTLTQTIIGEFTITINGHYDNITFVSDGANWLIK